jgi:Skp family chaperone for outer membrane proteins
MPWERETVPRQDAHRTRYTRPMALTDVETYRQLEKDYERALEEYGQLEAAYRGSALGSDSSRQVYEQLEAKSRELQELYAKLREMRNNLAQRREEAPQKVLASVK